MSQAMTAPPEHPGDWPAEGLERAEACPACGCRSRALAYRGLRDRLLSAPGRWQLWRCRDCASLYLDPRPSPNSIGRAYEGAYTTHQETPSSDPVGALARLRRALLLDYLNDRYGYAQSAAIPGGRWLIPLIPGARARTGRWIRHLRHPGRRPRLLDLGCGNGEFLLRMSQFGWEVQGLDFDREALHRARRAGLEVREGTIDALDPGTERFHAITLSHVAEHLHDPRASLSRARELLHPGGTLWLATPNAGSLGHRHFGDSWLALDPPRHLVIYTPDALTDLLRQAGFEQITVHGAGPDASWLFGPSSAIRHGRAPLGDSGPAPAGVRIRERLARLFSAADPRLSEELIVSATRPPSTPRPRRLDR